MKKGVLALSILFLLTSCSLKPLPSQRVVFINENFKGVSKVANSVCKINVDYSECSNAFDSYTVYVQTGRNQLEPLSNYEWIDTPCNMIKDSIQDVLSIYGCRIDLNAKNKLSFDLIKFQPVLVGDKRFCEVEVSFKLFMHGKQYFTIIDKKEGLNNVKFFASLMSKLVDLMDKELIEWIDKKIEPTTRRAQDN